MIFIGVMMTNPNGKRMNYETATDFEINKAVAKALGHEFCVSHHPESENAIIIIDDSPRPTDYCNDPADALPIIVENKIESGHGYAKINWFHRNDQCQFSYEDTNRFRAAMIVFLKMKDAEKSYSSK